MNLFQNILQTIQDRLKISLYDYESIASLVSVILQIPILKDQVLVKGNILFLEVSPLVRHEIYIKKALLLTKLQEHSFSFVDIKTTTA